MKVNMDDLLLAGLLDNDDELILLSQVCSGSDVPSFEKGFDLDTYKEEQSKATFRFIKMTFVMCVLNWVYLHTYMVTCTSIRLWSDILRLHVQNDLATLHRTSFLLVPT